MSNYTKTTNFATKDNLSPGNPLKIVKGTEIDTEYNNIATAVATKTDNSAAAITGGTIVGITDLAVADGGTGASTAAGALNNLLPSQTSNANKYLQTDGTNATWDAVSLSTSDITGTLAVLNGGTGVTTSTGTTNVVLSNSPTLVTPALGTPSSAVLTNATGLPISTGVSGLGSGVATLLATPSSANLASAITDETGSGSLVFATSPTLVTPILGTPTSGTLTNATGLPISTGVSGLGTGVATFLGTPSSANLISAVTDETGTGSLVFATSPTLVTPALGTPTSGVATNLTGLPLTTGVTGLLAVANGGTATATPSIVAGTNITVTGTWPNQTITASGGSGSVTSVAATVPSIFSISGSPITTSGTLAMTYSGTALPVANGGTGQTSYTDGQLLIGNTTGNTLTKSTLTAGTGVTITNGNGAITIAASGSATATTVSDTANSSTGYFQMPQGTTAQRPATAFAGYTRFNTTTGVMEYYTGTAWINTSSSIIPLDILVVAGGGGGGGGGGGAGGVLAQSFSITGGSSYTVTVGAGGTGCTNQNIADSTSGSNSVLTGYTAIGGGYGGSGAGNYAGANGGSGGGGSLSSSITGTVAGGTATSGQGNAGGSAISSSNPGWTGAGGGGAGAVGSSASNYNTGATSPYGGAGGTGSASSITGSSVTYGAGGQGYWSNTVSGNATANTGDGGGGSRTSNAISQGWNGGSGVVVIAYPDSSPALTVGSGLTYTQPTRSGYRVYRFTAGTGTITF